MHDDKVRQAQDREAFDGLFVTERLSSWDDEPRQRATEDRLPVVQIAAAYLLAALALAVVVASPAIAILLWRWAL